MAFTTVTLADTAKDPSGIAIPYAVVAVVPQFSFSDGTSTSAVAGVIAGSNGAFSLAGLYDGTTGNTALGLPAVLTAQGSYRITITDPLSGEHVFDDTTNFNHTANGGATFTLAQAAAQSV